MPMEDILIVFGLKLLPSHSVREFSGKSHQRRRLNHHNKRAKQMDQSADHLKKQDVAIFSVLQRVR